ncbi:YczE/YyaS/YitT family protein [Deinococcus planocerae]|uniref:membrane protein YczE n=1 Tax=Deinococcus planocerae TaxID=1737569 RepID=UPI001CA4856A|nr:membrane protein [Deinococcus planocerae]
MMIRRFVQLLVGLTLYGVSLALMVRAHLGLDPWDVFHQGVAQRLGWSLGTVVNVAGALVLLLWLPLRQWPGLGTVCNVLVIGLAVDAALALLPPVSGLPARFGLLVGGVLLNALATAAYIGAGLGPGPRDGLMTGLVRRTGRSVRLVRTGIEGVVLIAGWLLGGPVGVGTVAYALLIGPLVQVLLPHLTVQPAGVTSSGQASGGRWNGA